MTTRAFIYCLTLGPDIDLHAVYEVGLILCDGGSDQEQHWFLPVEGVGFAEKTWPDLERFFDEHPRGIVKAESKIASELGVTDVEIFARRFVALMRNAVVVGSAFDDERLRRIIRSQGFVQTWHEWVLDPDTLMLGCKIGSHSTDAPHEPEGRQFRGSALDGARRARALYDAVVGT